jgi:hypothetical protein
MSCVVKIVFGMLGFLGEEFASIWYAACFFSFACRSCPCSQYATCHMYVHGEAYLELIAKLYTLLLQVPFEGRAFVDAEGEFTALQSSPQ